MNGSGISKESNKNKLRGELNELMEGFKETFAGNSVSQDASEIIGKKLDEIAKPRKTYDFDLDQLDTQFKEKATLLINSMFDFYLDSGVIDRVEYVKRKRDLDTSNISNMLWQLKTVKITINVLMDEIMSGNTNQKTVSALSDMQTRFSEIIRMQANYVIFLEDSYKKMKYEVDATDSTADQQAKIEAAREEVKSNDFFLTANPKELIRQITEVSPLSDEEHDAMKAEGEDCISKDIGTKNTDPKMKEALMSEKNIDIEKNEDSAEGYDSILNMI